VAIAGRGCLNGQGWNWWWRNGEHDPARAGEARAAREAWCALYARIEAGAEPGPGEFALAAGFLRPSLVQFLGCRDVAVEGVTLRESPMWMLHPIDCAHVAVRGVDFVSTGPNGDGVAVDSCTDVRIEHCRFTTGDDCIVLKSGRDADGRRWGRPTERVTIAHCAMERGHGAVVIGSETAGGVRDVVARHIVTRGTDRGIRVKSMRGRGGVVERLRFEHWSIADAPVAAIEVTAHYQARPAEPFSERTPVLRDFSFHHVAITNARQVAAIAGLAECPIAQLRFTDLTAAGALGFHCDEAVAVDLRRVRVQASAGPDYCFGRVAQVERDGAPWAPAAPTETAGSAAAAGPAAPAPIGA
jgi:polygalacturonase